MQTAVPLYGSRPVRTVVWTSIIMYPDTGYGAVSHLLLAGLSAAEPAAPALSVRLLYRIGHEYPGVPHPNIFDAHLRKFHER
jgi:hypothetical protein